MPIVQAGLKLEPPASPPTPKVKVETIRDASKYNIIDPTTVKYVPRDAFISGLVGTLDATEVDIALGLIMRKVQAGPTFQEEFLRLATTYDTLRRAEARLPKFSKWVTSLYPKRAELAAEFARLGQKITNDVFEISGDVVDILRCSDTTHFASCFRKGSHMETIPKRIAEEAPGMCIIFADDPATGKMKARTWGIHVQDPDGKDALFLGSGRYGVIDTDIIASKIIAKFGIDVYKQQAYVYPPQPTKPVLTKLKTINAFKSSIYFDFQIWGTIDGVKIPPK